MSRMPELPEVEYAARIAREVAVGRTITSVRVLHRAQRRVLPMRVARQMLGARVLHIDRLGKVQRFHLTNGRRLDVHFRMTGDWVVCGPGDELPPHARAVMTFDGGAQLVLDDPRALSVLTLSTARDDDPAFGPDAIDPAFSATSLARALERRKSAIKLALLDQRVVAGLGNIYVAESLWRARIDPRTPANRPGPARLKRLVSSVRAVLTKAMRHGERYRTSGVTSAANRFAVYDREGEPCPRCRTPIRRIVQGARSTYFCPKCQR